MATGGSLRPDEGNLSLSDDPCPLAATCSHICAPAQTRMKSICSPCFAPTAPQDPSWHLDKKEH